MSLTGEVMSPDEAVRAMWAIENQFDDGGEVTFNAACDQWWVLSVFCAHSNWKNAGKGKPHRDVAIVQVNSMGPHDLTMLFVQAVREFRDVHDELVPNVQFQNEKEDE